MQALGAAAASKGASSSSASESALAGMARRRKSDVRYEGKRYLEKVHESFLEGREMEFRDSVSLRRGMAETAEGAPRQFVVRRVSSRGGAQVWVCLLYTSDAADEL